MPLLAARRRSCIGAADAQLLLWKLIKTLAFSPFCRNSRFAPLRCRFPPARCADDNAQNRSTSFLVSARGQLGGLPGAATVKMSQADAANAPKQNLLRGGRVTTFVKCTPISPSNAPHLLWELSTASDRRLRPPPTAVRHEICHHSRSIAGAGRARRSRQLTTD
jgi:hypothetical protein